MFKSIYDGSLFRKSYRNFKLNKLRPVFHTEIIKNKSIKTELIPIRKSQLRKLSQKRIFVKLKYQ